MNTLVYLEKTSQKKQPTTVEVVPVLKKKLLIEREGNKIGHGK